MTHLTVLSDLHLAPDGPLQSFHAGPALTALLDTLPAASTLVLAGDTLDLLQLPDHPGRLDLARAPDLVNAALDGIARTPWGPDLLAALSAFARRATLLILPGNHDPELFAPEVETRLRRRLDAPLTIHRAATPLDLQVGPVAVRVGHGHRGDTFNDLDPNDIHAALSRGDRALPLPPGSHLVLGPLDAFQRACDPLTGRPRFPFVSMLKPEMPGVLLLLLYLDPALALGRFPAASPTLARALARKLHKALLHSPTLGAPNPSPPAALDLPDLLALHIAAAATPAERTDLTVRLLEDHLLATPASAPGTLGLGRPAVLLRAALRQLSYDRSFWDRAHLSSVDRAIAEEHLPSGIPRVVIAGHTHAARDVRLRDGRHYLNTGTWSDLLPLPAMVDDADCLAWIRDITAGELAPERRLTWAEVTPDGARLREVLGAPMKLDTPGE